MSYPKLGLLLTLMVPGLLADFGQSQPPATDRHGDPLPDGAIARLGTTRWRHGGIVTLAAMLPDGKTVVTVSEDRTIRLWAFPSGKEIRRLAEPPAGPLTPGFLGRMGAVAALSADGKHLAVNFETNEIRRFDLVNGKELPPLTVQLRFPALSALAFAPNGTELACHDFDSTVHVLEWQTGKEIRKFGESNPAIIGGDAGLAYSPDGKTLAVGFMDVVDGLIVSKLHFYDPATGKEKHAFTSKEDRGPLGPVFSPDSKAVAFARYDGSITVVESATGKEIRKLPGDGRNAFLLAFGKDGDTLFARGVADPVVHEWDLSNGKLRRMFGGEGQVAGAFRGFGSAGLSLAPDGKTLLVCGFHHGMQLIDVASGKDITGTEGYAGPLVALRFSADGKHLLTQGTEPFQAKWEAATGKALGPVGEGKKMQAVAVSPNGQILVVRKPGAAALVDAASGKEIGKIAGRVREPFPAVQFSPDSKKLAVRWRVDQKLEMYEVATLKLLHANDISTGERQPGGAGVPPRPASDAMIFSGDGKWLAAYADPQTMGLWDVATGKRLARLPTEDRNAISSGAFTADGRCLVLDMSDGTVTVFELSSSQPRRVFGKKLPPPKEPMRPVNTRGFRPFMPQEGSRVALSPDGKTLAHAGPDRIVHVWEIDTGKELAAFKGHSGTVYAVAFSPDGKHLASASADTTALVWDLARAERSKVVIKAVGRDDLEASWKALAGADAVKAFDALCALTLSPKEAVALLKDQVKPAPPVDLKRVEELIGQLDSDQFKVRQKATAELVKIGERIVPSINKALAAQPPLETKQRLEDLREKMTALVLQGEKLQVARAVEVLERIGSKDARQVLQALAEGAPGAFATTTAQAALARLKTE
jgi:WD40 repeat protein